MKLLFLLFNWFRKQKPHMVKELAETDYSNISADQVNESDANTNEENEVIPIHKILYTTPSSYPSQLNASTLTRDTFTNVIERGDKGILEDYFFDYLTREFNSRIANNLRISNLEFIPDYTFIDEQQDVYLIIEIDEPYTLNNSGLLPIHIKGSDDVRNNMFLDKGWNIIRFAEEQVALYPDECIKYIKDFLEATSTCNLREIACWDITGAQNMINTKHRNTYLPFPLIDQERGNQQYSCRNFDVLTIEFNRNNAILTLIENQNQCIYCFIPLALFKDKFHSSNLVLLMKSLGIRPRKRLMVFYCRHLNVTAIGRINKCYFNVYNESIFFKFDNVIIDSIKVGYRRFIEQRTISNQHEDF